MFIFANGSLLSTIKETLSLLIFPMWCLGLSCFFDQCMFIDTLLIVFVHVSVLVAGHGICSITFTKARSVFILCSTGIVLAKRHPATSPANTGGSRTLRGTGTWKEVVLYVRTSVFESHMSCLLHPQYGDNILAFLCFDDNVLTTDIYFRSPLDETASPSFAPDLASDPQPQQRAVPHPLPRTRCFVSALLPQP